MPTLLSRIQSDLVTSMKARDSVRTDTLKMLKAAVTTWEIAQAKTAEDDDVLGLVGTQVKQRRDAAQQFRDGGRPELATKEEAEIAVLQSYLPEQLAEDELRLLVADAVAATGASGPKDLGKVMGVLVPKTKGRADGALVSRLVREALS